MKATKYTSKSVIFGLAYSLLPIVFATYAITTIPLPWSLLSIFLVIPSIFILYKTKFMTKVLTPKEGLVVGLVALVCMLALGGGVMLGISTLH